MIKIVLYSLVGFALIGCGGGGSGGSGGGGTIISNSPFLSPDDINLSKEIEDGKLVINGSDSAEDQYLAVINYLRSLKIKCNDSVAAEGPSSSDLTWNELLENSAQEHSDDMANVGFFTHDGSGTDEDITGQTFTPAKKSKFNERIKGAGYDYKTVGENIYVSFTFPNEAKDTVWIDGMQSWLTSKTGHCSNMMNSSFTDFGMAETRGEENKEFSDGATRLAKSSYWTQNFGSPK